MKIRFGDLKRVLKEAQATYLERNGFLFEDDSASHQMGTSGDSLDSQVDRYLAQYEGEAKKSDDEPSTDQMESLDWRALIRGHLITEAGEDDDADPDDAAAMGAGGDEGEDAAGAAGIGDEEEPEKLGLDKIDVAAFANSVVRLIENYDSMLEVRSTLQRRALSFLEKAYDDEVISAFKDTLRDDHGLVAGEESGSVEADKFPAPAADRANGSAAPGAGGGAPV